MTLIFGSVRSSHKQSLFFKLFVKNKSHFIVYVYEVIFMLIEFFLSITSSIIAKKIFQSFDIKTSLTSDIFYQNQRFYAKKSFLWEMRKRDYGFIALCNINFKDRCLCWDNCKFTTGKNIRIQVGRLVSFLLSKHWHKFLLQSIFAVHLCVKLSLVSIYLSIYLSPWVGQ